MPRKKKTQEFKEEAILAREEESPKPLPFKSHLKAKWIAIACTTLGLGYLSMSGAFTKKAAEAPAPVSALASSADQAGATAELAKPQAKDSKLKFATQAASPEKKLNSKNKAATKDKKISKASKSKKLEKKSIAQKKKSVKKDKANLVAKTRD